MSNRAYSVALCMIWPGSSAQMLLLFSKANFCDMVSSSALKDAALEVLGLIADAIDLPVSGSD